MFFNKTVNVCKVWLHLLLLLQGIFILNVRNVSMYWKLFYLDGILRHVHVFKDTYLCFILLFNLQFATMGYGQRLCFSFLLLSVLRFTLEHLSSFFSFCKVLYKCSQIHKCISVNSPKHTNGWRCLKMVNISKWHCVFTQSFKQRYHRCKQLRFLNF